MTSSVSLFIEALSNLYIVVTYLCIKGWWALVNKVVHTVYYLADCTHIGQRDQEWVPVTQIGRLVKDFETESLYRLRMACQPLLLQMLEGGAWMLRLLLVSVRLLLMMMVVANSLLLRLLDQEGIDLHSLLPSAD